MYVPWQKPERGQKKNEKTRKNKSILKSSLIQAGRAASNSKNTYLNTQYKRIAARRGANRAVVAVGHSILVICYHMIKNKTAFNELGGDYFTKLNKDDLLKRHIKRIEELGYKVFVEEAA